MPKLKRKAKIQQGSKHARLVQLHLNLQNMIKEADRLAREARIFLEEVKLQQTKQNIRTMK